MLVKYDLHKYFSAPTVDPPAHLTFISTFAYTLTWHNITQQLHKIFKIIEKTDNVFSLNLALEI